MASPAATSLIEDLTERAEVIAAEVLRRNSFACAALADDDRRRVESVVYSVAARLLDEARTRLEELDAGDGAAGRIAIVRELFALEAETVSDASAAGG